MLATRDCSSLEGMTKPRPGSAGSGVYEATRRLASGTSMDRSRAMAGGSSDTRYEYLLTRAPIPGNTSAETAAPPTDELASKTSTEYPDRARYAAVTKPLWPAPTTMQSITG